MKKILRNCTTCSHENIRHMCEQYCINFKNHEFKCDYCKHKLIGSKRFCECENEDGSQNCCGDHFIFNDVEFRVL
jgi:hypothetical protein